MNTSKFKTFVLKTGDALKTNAPQIAIVTGVIGLIGAGVWACFSSTKVKDVTEKHINNLNDIKEAKKRGEYETDKSYRSDHLKAVCHMGWDYIKLYGGPVLLAGVSATGILCGKKKLVKNARVSAGVAASTKAMFDSYRRRVAARIGEEAERDIFNGVTQVEKKEEKLDKKTGETKEVTKKETTLDENALGLYSYRYAKPMFNNYEKSLTYNLSMLKNEEATWNTIGRNRAWIDPVTGQTLKPGKVWLSEILDSIGINWSMMDQDENLRQIKEQCRIVGWQLDPNGKPHQNGLGDNCICFGLPDPQNGKLINPWEDELLLTFNCDGIIYGK